MIYLVILGAVPLAMGCNQQDPHLVQVRGTVVFQGKPLPIGMIVFEPDPGKGNRGPQGHAAIKNGQFDTSHEGKGVSPGAQLVRITGGDGVNPEAFTPLGNLLFEEQTLHLDIVQEQPLLHLELPVP